MRLLTGILVLLGCLFVGDACYIKAKAILAQWLIESAWAEVIAGHGDETRPWGWADTWPVARMRIHGTGADLFILKSADGSSLAFGPGHLNGTAMPGFPGTSVIAGHRDTHFSVLQRLSAGDLISIQSPQDKWTEYTVDSSHVVDTQRVAGWQIDPTANELNLVTCYPFDAINPGGPLRYVVVAKPVVVPRQFNR